MRFPDLTDSRILIADERESNLRQLSMVLESAGYNNVKGIGDSRRILSSLREFAPDLILLDLQMGQTQGLAPLHQLTAATTEDDFLPVLVYMGDNSFETKERALSRGASDILSTPFQLPEVQLRVRNLLRTRSLHRRLTLHSAPLEEQIRQRTNQLADAQSEILSRLARAAEYQDDDTEEHTRRVGELAARLGRALGEPENRVGLLALAAPLHDVGKVGLPHWLLVKTGKLTLAEFNIVKSHTTIGAEILGRSQYPVLQMAREIALSHHERWDGTGYPMRLKGERIPQAGRIVAVVDAFDVMTHDSPFRKARPVEQAIAEIRQQIGLQFDPAIADAFLKMMGFQLAG